MGYSGKIDVMIDFIEFESFWFDPTVHDISNNLYGFSKCSFFIISIALNSATTVQ